VRGVDRGRGAVRTRDPDAALSFWRALVAGRWSLVDRFERDGRRFVVAHRNAPTATDPRRLTESGTVVGRFLTLGYSNKLAAYSLGVSEGTVSGTVARIRHELGAGSRVDLIDRLASGGGEVDGTTVELASGELAVIASDARRGEKERSLPASLTAAERAVVQGVLTGRATRRSGAIAGPRRERSRTSSPPHTGSCA
jgi:DNA-binding CsgD family transcriptional regulator